MTSKEALDRLKFIWDQETNIGSKSPKELDDFWGISKPLKVIDKLVERDTPKKVIKDTIINGECLDYSCPSCKVSINTDNLYPDLYYLIKHCIYCGQRLDWSELK